MKTFAFVISIFIIVLCWQNTVAQIIQKGNPRFLDESKIEIPIIILQDFDLEELLQEDEQHKLSGFKSLRFAININLDVNIKKEGFCKVNSNGDKIWYLKIKSSGAYSLGLLFDYYRLPVGAELFVYSADKKHIRGTFTYINNKSNYILPIAPVKGDEIIIEYYEPKDIDFKGEIHLSSVAHDYKNIFNYFIKESAGFGASGECNININCEDDELWQTLKHSVCKITYNGRACSGALINNTRHNGDPYFLTANHCIDNAFDASSAVFYFNYESPDCTNEDGQLDQTISGSTIIATPPSKTLDFTLLELSIKPPSSYKPYYAGWNRDVSDPLAVTSIHHPKGDIKKITKSFDGATTSDYGEEYNEFTHWWIDAWDEGTTEDGSSGSPLFDQNGLIIGDLSGGSANCDFNFNDYYQQFYHSWDNYSDINCQLKNWLNPKNSGVISISGYQPFDTIPSHLRASVVDTVINLWWNETIDSSNVECHYIYRNASKIDSTDKTFYSDTQAYKNIAYQYWVTAKYVSPIVYESDSSNIINVRTMNPITLPFGEDFEGKVSLPELWYEEKSEVYKEWEFIEGGYSGVLDTAFEGSVNAYFLGTGGETSKLVLPRFDFSLNTNVLLSFYLNMQEFNDSLHKLRVLYKEADSLNWELIRTYNSEIVGWEKKSIVLPNLSDNYQIALEGIGLGGYGIAIDSLLIIEDLSFIEPDIISDKDTICVYDSVEYTTSLGAFNNLKWNFGDDAFPKFAFGAGPHKVKYKSSGIKPVSLIVDDTYIKHYYDIVVVLDILTPVFTQSGNVLTSNLNYGNQWYYNGEKIIDATEQTCTIGEDGDYFVEVTNLFNCVAISENRYIVLNGIDETEDIFKGNEKIKIYPNPNKGNFIIELNIEKRDTQFNYYLIDITGRIVHSGVVYSNKESNEINTIGLNNGIYFIKIYSDQNYHTSKILIKK